MTTVPITVPNYDPYQYVNSVVRALGGPVQEGAVTFDVDNGFCRWVYVGSTGDLYYKKWDGTTGVCKNIAAGVWHPVISIAILSATTIAADQLRWGS